MGNWQGYNYEEIEPPGDPKQASTEERRAALYRRVKELGHPNLLDADEKKHQARKFDVSYRQINYDMEAVAEYVRETLDLEKHLTDVTFVFEKAMSEAIADGDWQEAADIAMQQAEWLERRGVISNEDVERLEIDHQHDWRQFIEKGETGHIGEKGEIPVEATDESG